MCEHLFEALECRVDDVTELGGYCGGVAGYNEAQSEEDVGELAAQHCGELVVLFGHGVAVEDYAQSDLLVENGLLVLKVEPNEAVFAFRGGCRSRGSQS